VPLAKLQELVRYWASGYDWRKVEARLNAPPQFMTTIDAVDIHFIHVRSRQQNALPLIVTHGWPGSIIEQLKIGLMLATRRPWAWRKGRSWRRRSSARGPAQLGTASESNCPLGRTTPSASVQDRC
jgi:hypothetical protein